MDDWLVWAHAICCAVTWVIWTVLPKLITFFRFMVAFVLCIQGKEYKQWLENDAPGSDISSSELISATA